jgi:hypothetical protein
MIVIMREVPLLTFFSVFMVWIDKDLLLEEVAVVLKITELFSVRVLTLTTISIDLIQC